MKKKLTSCVIHCDSRYRKQCLSQFNSYACKVRYFNGRCLMAQKILEKGGNYVQDLSAQR